MPIITISKLTKFYKRRVGIENLDLEIREGELFGFLGPNGSGKTTTIRLLLGFMKPTLGSALVFGKDCWRESTIIKKEIGYLPGDLRLYPWLTCRTAARFLGNLRQRKLEDAFDEWATIFDLDPEVPVRKMSRGMRQKLGLILAMAHRPRLLIFDEPTSALDPLVQITLFDQLRTFSKEGHTIFFSSHMLSEVESLCDRVAILKDGHLVTSQRVRELRKQAYRQVTIRWHSVEESTRIQPPNFLRIHSNHHGEWDAVLHGESMELVHWCSAHPIADLSIAPPDLAQVFQAFYDKKDEEK